MTLKDMTEIAARLRADQTGNPVCVELAEKLDLLIAQRQAANAARPGPMPRAAVATDDPASRV